MHVLFVEPAFPQNQRLFVRGLHMSGARAVFVPAASGKPAEKALAEAFEEKGMKLESYEEVSRPCGGGWVLVDSGVT